MVERYNLHSFFYRWLSTYRLVVWRIETGVVLWGSADKAAATVAGTVKKEVQEEEEEEEEEGEERNGNGHAEVGGRGISDGGTKRNGAGSTLNWMRGSKAGSDGTRLHNLEKVNNKNDRPPPTYTHLDTRTPAHARIQTASVYPPPVLPPNIYCTYIFTANFYYTFF